LSFAREWSSQTLGRSLHTLIDGNLIDLLRVMLFLLGRAKSGSELVLRMSCELIELKGRLSVSSPSSFQIQALEIGKKNYF